MNITPLILETAKLRAAAATARIRAAAIRNPAEVNRLADYTSALEARAKELDGITSRIFDDWLAGHPA